MEAGENKVTAVVRHGAVSTDELGRRAKGRKPGGSILITLFMWSCSLPEHLGHHKSLACLKRRMLESEELLLKQSQGWKCAAEGSC